MFKGDTSPFLFEESRELTSKSQDDANVKYFDLKDLIENSDDDINIQIETLLPNTNQTFSNINLNPSVKYIPKQPPKPKLTNPSETAYLEIQQLPKEESEYDTNIFYQPNHANTLPSSDIAYSSMSHISRDDSVNNYASNDYVKLPSAHSNNNERYPSMHSNNYARSPSPHSNYYSRSPSAHSNNYLKSPSTHSNNYVRSTSMHSNRSDSYSQTAWSNSEYLSLPLAKPFSKIENLSEIFVEGPRKLNGPIEIITDSNEILNIDMHDPSYVFFEVSKVYPMEMFGSLENFFYSKGFQFGDREVLEKNGDYEISEIILIF